MSFGTFVCSRCAGLLRDLTYKVKGIGVCNFSDQELAFLNKMGNDVKTKYLFYFSKILNKFQILKLFEILILSSSFIER